MELIKWFIDDCHKDYIKLSTLLFISCQCLSSFLLFAHKYSLRIHRDLWCWTSTITLTYFGLAAVKAEAGRSSMWAPSLLRDFTLEEVLKQPRGKLLNHSEIEEFQSNSHWEVKRTFYDPFSMNNSIVNGEKKQTVTPTHLSNVSVNITFLTHKTQRSPVSGRAW